MKKITFAGRQNAQKRTFKEMLREMRQLPVRLPPGCDLRCSLESLGRDRFPDGAFVVCGIGSLIDPRLRLAAEDEEAHYEGPFEILTLSGTVTRQGAHLHMSIASSAGDVSGGHVVYGNVVRTTAELLLVQAPEWQLSRERDAETGFLELVARRDPINYRTSGEQAMATHTVRLHRVLRTSPDKLYRAFVEPSAFERWLPPFGFVGKVHGMDPVVGGAWRMSFTNFGTGHSHSFGGKYLELVPGQRVAYDATFDDPNLPGTMKTTVTLTPVSCGTELSVVQEGIPEMIPVEMCYLGWQESLVALAQLVEPNIPG